MSQQPEIDRPLKLISGGQTGVDRAALDVAIELALPHGGWCPRGRLAEDGPLSLHYRLVETRSPRYSVRTRLNVRDSDGTLILYRGAITGGTRLTRQIARQLSRPCICGDLGTQRTTHSQLPSPHDETLHDEMLQDEIARWLARHNIRCLNVAGPRESTSPGIYQQAYRLLRGVLSTWQLTNA